MSDYVIRAERADDTVAIAALVALAFKGVRHSDGSEPQIVERLRRAGALTVSLVAEEGWDILGHVAFSPVTIADGTEGWFGLGPVAVTPGRQREGIGAALVEAGMLEKRRYSERPPRDDYVLTEAGRDYLPVLQALGGCARKHFGEGAISQLVEAGSGRTITPLVVDAETGTPLSDIAVMLRQPADPA